MPSNSFPFRQRLLNFWNWLSRRDARVSLRESHARLRAILEAVPDLLFEVDLEGRIYDYHSPRTDLLTSSPARLIGQRVSELLPPDASAIVMLALQEAAAHEFSTGRRYALTLAQGRMWFELSVARKASATGELPRFIALARDVTERVQIETQESQRNQALELLATGAPVTDTLQAIIQAVEQLNQGLRCRIAFLDSNGQERRVQSATNLPELPSRSDPILSSSGQLLGYLLIFPDQAHRPDDVALQQWISLAGIAIERSVAAQEMRASEMNYRTLIHWTPQPIAVHRGEKFLYLNPAAVELFGARLAQDLIGTPVMDRIAPKFRPMGRARQKYFEEHGATPRVEQQFLKVDGSIIDVEVQSTSIAYDGEQAVHLALHDISERKRSEAQLHKAMSLAEDASRAKSRFLAAASHDLRQPTHAMGMFVARLGQLPHDAETRDLIDKLETSVQVMRDLLDGLLDVSRLDAMAVPVQIRAFPLADLFDKLLQPLSLIAAEKGLRLRIRPTSVWLQSDPALLYQILYNLLGNALRYSVEGGVLLACRVRSGTRQARIEVWDTGIGIAPEHQQAIFTEFYQVGNVERDRGKGLGLGLNIVQRTAALLQHPLQMWSKPGVGSRFSVEVPLAVAAAIEYRHPEPAQPLVDLEDLVVMVIEDDALARESLVGLIEGWRAVVVAAEGLDDARTCLQAGVVPDVIISDYRLRDGDNGIDVLHRLRLQAGRSVPACLISGDTDPALLIAARQAGLTLLHKPVRPAKLRSLIARLIKPDLSLPPV